MISAKIKGKSTMFFFAIVLLPLAGAFSSSRIGQSRQSCQLLNMACNQDVVPESAARRQLLFSMLGAYGSTTFLAPNSAEAVSEAVPKLVDTPLLVEDWSDINIIKPPKDDRDYLAYILDNGLKVILCSDPLSNEAGAAMDCHVGACSDPKDIRGLAHFNEHMLFLGTKDYPNEDSFESFLSANGGSSNAYTASEDTVYHFALQGDDRLEEGLKRFGSFFTSPLFTEAATGRELNAIESENAKNLQSDNFRIYQISKARQNREHPHSKFFTGNKKTLLDDTKKAGLNLRNELIEFYNSHYSSNQMTLAVVGPQSLDKLKAMVETAFGEIPNRNLPKPEDEWKRVIPPFGGNSLIEPFGNFLKVVPVQDIRQLSISWPIVYTSEQDYDSALLTKQANYVAHLMGHEGPGSLISYLKRNGLGNSVSSGNGDELSDFETFECTVGLTKAGLSAVDQVIEAVFSYLSMLKDRTIPKHIFNEVLQLEELQWRYVPKGDVSNYVQSLATSLEKYPPSLCVAGPRRLALSENANTLITSSEPRSGFTSQEQLAFTTSLTTEYVEKLTVDNAMFTIMSKSFEGKTDRKEEWYGTDFTVEPIPQSALMKWKNCASPKSLGIGYPKQNQFIPSESGLKVKYPPAPVDRFKKRTFEDRMTPIPPPEIIRDDQPDGRWTLYFKPDDRFGQPKAFVIFELLTKEVYSTARNAALSNFYEFCVTDKLGEYAYDAGLAGLTYDIKVVPRGVRLTFGGYNDKLQRFASYISKKLSVEIKDLLPKDETEFERYQDVLSRSFAAFDVKQPYAHCASFSQLLLQPPKFQYSNAQMREETAKATLDDLISYADSLWSSGKGVALIQGNLDKKEALKLVSTIDKTLSFKSIPAEDYPPTLKPVQLPPIPAKSMPTKLIISEPNSNNGNSASYVVIQSLSEDPKEHVMMELLGSIVAEPFYENLRTKQQLGYIVSSGIRALGKTRFVGFIVQSSVASTDKLTVEIMKYLDAVRPNLLVKLNEGDFAVYVKSLIERKTDPDKQLVTEVTRNWGEIGSGRLQFDRVQQEVGALLDLSKTDLLEFWDRLYVNDGRRVLITEMVPRVGAASTLAPPLSYKAIDGSNYGRLLGIDDIEELRSDLNPYTTG
jgi:insulysin